MYNTKAFYRNTYCTEVQWYSHNLSKQIVVFMIKKVNSNNLQSLIRFLISLKNCGNIKNNVQSYSSMLI